jgi:hypothetical protein
MILFKEFEKSDLGFKPIEKEADIWSDEFADAVERSKLAVSGTVDGKVVGCGGVHPIDDFSGELWIRLSDWSLDHKIEIVRWLKAGLEIIEEKFPFKQLNAHVKEGFVESEKIMRFLGFDAVGLKDGFTIFAKRVQE